MSICLIVSSQAWSIHSLFDRTIDQGCPVAQKSDVVVALPTTAIYAIKPEPPLIEGSVAVYDVNTGQFIIIFSGIGARL
jgi:phosphatidylinositol glycan class T